MGNLLMKGSLIDPIYGDILKFSVTLKKKWAVLFETAHSYLQKVMGGP